MNFKIESLSTIRMHVLNVADSSIWYQSFFDQIPTEKNDKFASFKIANVIFELVEPDDRSPQSKGGSVGYWRVDNLSVAIQHAINLRGKIYRGPLKVAETQQTIAQIQDPYGNILGLIENHFAGEAQK